MPLLASRLVHRHLCVAGAEFGTCQALREHLGGCTATPGSGFFTTREQPQQLRCGINTCCPSWREGACWMCGLRWNDGAAVSPTGCADGLRMRRLGRADVERCLRGKLLVFQGDSLTRQLFNRLIWWLRGVPANLEHYYQRDAYYSFSERFGDELIIRQMADAKIWNHLHAALTGNATLDPDHAHILLMHFRNSRWSETDGNIAGGRFLLRSLCDETRPDACVVHERRGGPGRYTRGIGWGVAPIVGVVQGQMGRIAVHRPRPDNQGYDFATLSVGALAESAPLPLYRNVVCMNSDGTGGLNWTQATPRFIHHGHINHLPPLCEHNDGHFQCSFNSIAKAPSFFKRPLNGDCRDLANLNVMQMILTSLCIK